MADASRKRRILVAGDVRGEFAALFDRVAALCEAKGPFDYLFCAGAFFDAAAAGDAAAAPEPLRKEWPLHVYFHDASHAPGELADTLRRHSGTSEEAYEVAPGVRYLGRCGLRVVDGFTVAVLAAGATPTDVGRVARETRAGYRGADLLLSSGWPGGILRDINASSRESLATVGLTSAVVDAEPGADEVAAMAAAVRPRYHFAGGAGCFFSRQPYVSSAAASANDAVRVTRFVGLGPVAQDDGGKDKKWIHAIGVSPIIYTGAEELQKEPKGSTRSPYESAAPPRGFPFGNAGGPHGGLRSFDPRQAASRFAAETNSRMAVRDGPGRKRKIPGMDDPANADNTTVFVGNLGMDHGLTSAALTGFFAPVGNVVRVHLPEGKPFGFVEFATPAEAQRCIASMNHASLGRLTLKLGFGKSRIPDPGAPEKRPRPAPRFPRDERTKCWFCLATPELEAHLIVHVGEEVYVASPKGALTPQHCLLVPIEHVGSLTQLTPGAHAEMSKFRNALERFYTGQGLAPLLWERCVNTLGTHHMHVQVLPVPIAELGRMQEVLQGASDAHGGAHFEEIPFAKDASALTTALGESKQYMYLQIPQPDGEPLCLLHRVPEEGKRLPMHFGRILGAELLRMRHRAHWKSCVIPQPDEEAMASALRDVVIPFLEA